MDQEFQNCLITELPKPGRRVISPTPGTRPLEPLVTQQFFRDSIGPTYTAADHPSPQKLDELEPSGEIDGVRLPSTATPPIEEAEPVAKTDQEEKLPARASQTFNREKTDPQLHHVEHILAMKAATARMNAYSGYIESNQRLQKHQERMDDDRIINEIRANMAVFSPQPLADEVEINAEPPIDLLPQPAAELIRGISAHFGPAPEMALIVFLGTMFISARGNFAIRVGPQHREALTGYLVGAAPSGQRKSAIVGYFRAFFDEVERELRKAHLEEGNETSHELSQFALGRIKAKLAQDFSDLAETDGVKYARSAFKEKIVALERAAKSLRIGKHEPRLLTDLTTPEKLAEDLERQGEATGILVAEGGYWKRLIAKYDDLPLRAFTGEPFSSSTRSVASIHLRSPIMAICTLVQPNVLNGLFGNEELAAHGLTARILPVYIRSRKSGGAGPEIPDALAHWLRERIHTLLKIKRDHTSGEMPAPHVIDIDDEGKAHIARYQAHIKAELAAGRFDQFQPFADKLVGHAIRLAGAIHLMKHADPQNHKIDLDSIVVGIALAEYFRQHAEVAFNPEKREGGAFARKILGFIVEDPSLFRFSPRDIQRRIHGSRAHQIQAGLNILERHGYLRRYVRNGKIDYIVHPNATWWLAR